MSKDNIIKLARKIWCESAILPFDDLHRFANLVAAAEREACAQIVDDFGDEWMCDSHMLSKQIRARGNT